MSKRDSLFLFKQALRQAICEHLNRHVPGDQADIALIGSRRSGSTLLMQIIAHQPGIKSVDQPFGIFGATSAHMNHLGYPSGGVFAAVDRQTRSRAMNFVKRIQSGEIHVREPWRFWKGDFHFRTNRLVLKTTDASFLTELFVEMGLISILYFRHPASQAISCKRNRWGDKIEIFAESLTVVNDYLNADQRELLREFSTREPLSIDRYVLSWCIENSPLFSFLQAGLPTVYYEDVVLKPDETLETIASVCKVQLTPAMRNALMQPSLSVKRLSDDSATNAIKSNNTSALVGRWREQLDDETIERLQVILDHFPGCPYRMDQLLPLGNA